MPRKPLRREEVPAGPIHVGDRRVPQRVERVKPIESGLRLPVPERELDPALAGADAGLGADSAPMAMNGNPR